MDLTTSEVAAAVGGRSTGPDTRVRNVATDSREVKGGELFVPLVAARDGHDFIPMALAAGAAAYLTARTPGPGVAIAVGDTAAALAQLARHTRVAMGAATIGITGSVGKTTTKDLCAAILSTRYRVHASRKSFNNHIGVPLTILNAPEGTEALVLEIGANAPGEIAGLCAIGLPTIGAVTRVAPVHTLGFGDIEGVARAKAELVAALPADGGAVLNADDERVVAMAGASAAPVVTFGRGVRSDVGFEVLELGPDLRALARFSTPWGVLEARLAVRGAHQAYNAAAAVAVGGLLGVAPEAMADALAQAEVSGMRMELRRAPSGLAVLDDSYNASPVAVEAALAALASVPAKRRVAVLGPMAELGRLSGPEHRRVAQVGERLGVEVIAVGAPEYGVENLGSPEEVLSRLAELGEGDIVLVKGSRGAGLDRLAAALSAGSPSTAGPAQQVPR